MSHLLDLISSCQLSMSHLKAFHNTNSIISNNISKFWPISSHAWVASSPKNPKVTKVPKVSDQAMQWLDPGTIKVGSVILGLLPWPLQLDRSRSSEVFPAWGGGKLEGWWRRWWQQTWNFLKKNTRPNFRAKEFYTLKMRKLRLFSPAINSKIHHYQ